jgi:hypothetical protein
MRAATGAYKAVRSFIQAWPGVGPRHDRCESIRRENGDGHPGDSARGPSRPSSDVIFKNGPQVSVDLLAVLAVARCAVEAQVPTIGGA